MRNRLFCLAAGTLLLAGCESSVTGTGTPQLSILLTDAPGDFAEAKVKIEQIYLQGDGENGRVMLMEGGTEYIDLLTLAGGGTAELVDGAVVDAGTYSELRFVICDAYIKTKDGKVYATQGASLPAGVTADGRLQAPSFCESGLKVKLPGGSVTLDDQAKVLVVDFDVSQSFGQQAGQSGMWVMRPVLHATDFEASGTIAGMVAFDPSFGIDAQPASCGGKAFGTGQNQVALLGQFVPRVQDGEDLRSGLTDAAGAYKIHFVTPGEYAPTFASEIAYDNGDKLAFQATASLASVTVESGKTATVNFTVTNASCTVATAATNG